MPCDILLSAALENTVDLDIAKSIKAQIVLEGANGAVMCDADEELNKRRIVVVPDLLCGAGSAISSYLEWIKNLEHIRLGRLLKGWEVKTKKEIMRAMKREVDITLEKEESGPSERDIVHSALEDVIHKSAAEVMDYSL